MKKSIILTLVFICSLWLFTQTFFTLNSYAYSDNNDLIIALMHPHIENAIEDYYGYNRRYEIGDSKVRILERHGNVFRIEISVDTFEGAHSDYYTELMTFTVSPSYVSLDEYIHSEFIPHN